MYQGSRPRNEGMEFALSQDFRMRDHHTSAEAYLSLASVVSSASGSQLSLRRLFPGVGSVAVSGESV